MKRILILFLLLILALPVSAIVTWVLLPLWDGLERTFGIESVGHSGPADWCYWATFCGVVLLMGTVWIIMWRRKKQVTHASGEARESGPPHEGALNNSSDR
jgi:hypothetical protein